MRHNGRPALRASRLFAADINLHPGEPVTVVCTDCRTWRKLTRGMVPAHRSTDLGRELVGTDGHQVRRDTRCPGSGQRVEIDLTVAQWVTRIEDGLTETAACRPTKVLRKVPTPKPPALHQLTPAAPTADSARRTYETHRSRCAACTGRVHCKDGARLALTYLELLRQEPERREAAARAEQEQRIAAQSRAAALLRQRAAEWDDVEVDVLLAKRRRASYVLHSDSSRRLYGPDLQIEERDTREESRALAETRTEAAIRQASPLRRTTAA